VFKRGRGLGSLKGVSYFRFKKSGFLIILRLFLVYFLRVGTKFILNGVGKVFVVLFKKIRRVRFNDLKIVDIFKKVKNNFDN
jgi:hypothetical protein